MKEWKPSSLNFDFYKGLQSKIDRLVKRKLDLVELAGAHGVLDFSDFRKSGITVNEFRTCVMVPQKMKYLIVLSAYNVTSTENHVATTALYRTI